MEIKLDNATITDIISNVSVHHRFPVLKAIYFSLKDKKIRYCCGSVKIKTDSDLLSQAKNTILNMNSEDVEKLKKTLGLNNNDKFVK